MGVRIPSSSRRFLSGQRTERAQFHVRFVSSFAMKRPLVIQLLLLAVATAKFSANPFTDCTKDPASFSATLRLRRNLSCNYDSSVRPAVSNNNSTDVTLNLIPKFIEFDDGSNTITLHTWMAMYWTDTHLKWEPNDFDGLLMIHISSSEIWSPDISVYNSGDMGLEQNGLPKTDCVLMFGGVVVCVPALKYVARCVADYQHWPFDRQNCTLRLGSWSHTGEEINYHLPPDGGVEMRDFTPNHEWKVLSINATKRVQKFKGMSDSFPSLFFNVVIERHSTSLKATVVGPVIVLIIMTLTVLWLSPATTERLALAALNLICHLLCVIDINWQVPFNGASLPSILIFHQNSMIIASVVLLLTVILRQLGEMSLPAPVWLVSTTSGVLGSRVGQFVLLTTLDPKAPATLGAEDDNATLVESNSSSTKANIPDSEAWRHFVTLLDRVLFVAVFLIYFIMIIVLIPKNDINEATGF